LNLSEYLCFLFQFAAYLKKKNALGQKGEQKKKKKVENYAGSPKEVSVAEESLDSSPVASSLEDSEGNKLVSSINWLVCLNWENCGMK
jgi:hypothetical protein